MSAPGESAVAMGAPAAEAGSPVPRYVRLPGRSRGIVGTAALWLGADHVLLVQTRGYTEYYRRFYFRDVQALLLRRTSAARNVSFALVAFLLIMIAAAAASGNAWPFWIVAAVPLATALLLHLLYGPSCVCHVRTAVETTELTALRRVRAASKTLARLRALVEDAQGTMTTDEIVRAADATAGVTSEVAPPPVAAAPPPMPARVGLRGHWILFALLLVDAAVSAGQALTPGRVL